MTLYHADADPAGSGFWPAAPRNFAGGRIYGIGIVAAFIQNRTMIYVSQGTLRNLRNDLFGNMEKLPIKYFDTHAHGDIMSIYTNDIDTLRQMISQSIPQIINSAITIVSVFVSMLILNIPLTITTLVMVSIMLGVTKKVAGFSGNFFVKQQRILVKSTALSKR